MSEFDPDPIGPAGRSFLAKNAETMLRLLIGATQNLGGEITPELRSELILFRGQAIQHGIDVIALSEEPA